MRGSGGSLFLRKGLVTAQVALSFLLLFGAGLFVRSLQNLKTTDTGVALDNLVTFQVSPALSGYDDAARRRLLPRPARTAALRAGHHVGRAWRPCRFSPATSGTARWRSRDTRPKDGEDMQAFMNALSPGYFKTMKIPMLEGRDFRESDARRRGHAESPASPSSIAGSPNTSSPARARSASSIGWGGGPKSKLNIEIIGVVADSLYEGPREGVQRQVFIPFWGKNSSVFYLRTQRLVDGDVQAIRNEVRELDTAMPVYGMKTVEAQLDETLLTDRLIAMLSAGFGLLATLLASIGLYGVMAFVVARRKKELGIRLALARSRVFVIWLVMREVLLLLAIGLAIGIPAAMRAWPLTSRRSSMASSRRIRRLPLRRSCC